MRVLLLPCLLLLGSVVSAQTPAPAPPAAPRPMKPAPTQPAPAARRPQAPPTRSTMAITVTNPRGMALVGIEVELIGPTPRSAETEANGQLNLTGLAAGTYRVRFGGNEVITFEKEVTLRAGQSSDVDVVLNPAPPPPPPPPPPPAPEPPPAPIAVGPAGDPRTLSVVDLAERELVGGNVPRRETLISCSGNTRTTLVQMNQDQPTRLYDTAEVSYYVIAGEGAVRLNGRDTAIAAGSLVTLPRETSHGLVRRGRRPLILLMTLSGAPCEEGR